MFKSKYSTVLTVFLVILIIAILIIITIIAINAYKNYEDEKERGKIIADLQQQGNESPDDNEIDNNNIGYENLLIGTIDDNSVGGNTTGGGSSSRPKTKFYKEYPMIGTIEIEKTGIEYPILLDISPKALETSVGVMYPSNPTLNEPGNVVIIGHNYRNGKFFSDNKNLVIGDEIKITDLTGRTLTYTIYEINQTSETDTEYITRPRGDNIEISLSTCTDDGKLRLVILARVE